MTILEEMKEARKMMEDKTIEDMMTEMIFEVRRQARSIEILEAAIGQLLQDR